ncbi:hypothetical protein GCM10008955_09380 [Deinococcus malanensis]|uniref:Rieske-like [2Fe-2S] domain-containing protein n=1 Tax=Deinococcus malanensis TaxID=1706855 RepID=A0ABQ2ES90_9DEIO|nr:hypothetical protein GCM10008955_09380 [Deinococcus malanensis]
MVLTGSPHASGTLRLKVASLLLKHALDLESGVSLDDAPVRVLVYEARIDGGEVWIGSEA